jgi:hypothetical protein
VIEPFVERTAAAGNFAAVVGVQEDGAVVEASNVVAADDELPYEVVVEAGNFAAVNQVTTDVADVDVEIVWPFVEAVVESFETEVESFVATEVEPYHYSH